MVSISLYPQWGQVRTDWRSVMTGCDDGDADRLSFIRRTRAPGFPLGEIRTLLDAIDGGDYSCADVRDLTARLPVAVRQKIAEPRKLEKALREMVRECDGGERPPCAVVEALRR